MDSLEELYTALTFFNLVNISIQKLMSDDNSSAMCLTSVEVFNDHLVACLTCQTENRNIMQIVLILTQKCWFVIPF